MKAQATPLPDQDGAATVEPDNRPPAEAMKAPAIGINMAAIARGNVMQMIADVALSAYQIGAHTGGAPCSVAIQEDNLRAGSLRLVILTDVPKAAPSKPELEAMLLGEFECEQHEPHNPQPGCDICSARIAIAVTSARSTPVPTAMPDPIEAEKQAIRNRILAP